MNRILIVYICLLNCFISARGQTHDYHIYNRQDGFTSTEMLSVVRDAYGRMWFSGNNGGVTFYDGKQFHALIDTSAHSILNAPTELRTAENDTTIVIWNSERGMSFVRNGKIKTYRVEEYPILRGGRLPSSGFIEGRIWGINGEGVIYQFEPKTDNFFEIERMPIEYHSLIRTDYYLDSKIYFCLLSSGFTHKIVKGEIGGKMITIRQTDARIDGINKVYCTKNGFIIISNSTKIRRYNGQKWQDVLLPLPTKNVLSPIVHFEHRRNRFFLVLKKDEKRRQIFEMNEDFKVLNSVIIPSRSTFRGIEKDLAGNFWVATTDGQFKIIPNFFNLYSRETDGMITDLHSIAEEPNGNIWFGSYSEGVTMFDGNRLFKHPRGTSPIWRIMPGSIFHDGQILMNVENDHTGVIAFDGKTWSRYLKDASAFFYITKLSDGRLALGGQIKHGLALQKEIGGRFYDSTDFRWIRAAKGMNLENVLSVAEDRLGHIWMGRSSQGLAVYDPHLDTAFTWFIQNAQTDFGAMSIISDDKGNVWFGTRRGVFLYKTPTEHSLFTAQYWSQFNPFKTFEPIGKGILNNIGNINSLKIWKNKYLIIGSSNGFCALDIQAFYASNGKRFPIFKFDEKHGFSGGSTEQNALWIDKNEKIWIGHDKGATLFDIQNFTTVHFFERIDLIDMLRKKTKANGVHLYKNRLLTQCLYTKVLKKVYSTYTQANKWVIRSVAYGRWQG